MTAISTTSSNNALAALSGLKQGLQNVVQAMPQSTNEPILKFGKDGQWNYGADSIEVEDGSLWAVNPLSLQHGYQAWGREKTPDEGKLLGETLVPATHPLPTRSQLADVDAPWKELISVNLRCCSGEDEGVQVIYKPSSKGGLDAMRGLINKLIRQLDEDGSRPVAVLTLGSDSYKHKQYGKIYTPVLEVQEWRTMDGEGADEPAAEIEAKTETRVEDEPKQRRRRG